MEWARRAYTSRPYAEEECHDCCVGHPPRFRGQLLAPGEQEYDAARSVFNAMIDRRPALIARSGKLRHYRRTRVHEHEQRELAQVLPKS